MLENQKPTVFRIDRNGVKRLIIIVMTLFIQGIIMFLAAGNFRHIRIWYFLILNLAYLIISFLIIIFYFPKRADIINQRGKFNKGTKKWDIVVISTISIVSLIIVPLVIGLDLGRVHWSDIPMGYFYSLIPLYLISQVLGQWALLVNPHFEPTVRIQSDRGHRVAQNGPYLIMRHPGYLSFILCSILTPIMLGSFVALIPTIIIVALFVVRTELEDNTLKKELAGYKEYAEKVHYRLIPYIW